MVELLEKKPFSQQVVLKPLIPTIRFVPGRHIVELNRGATFLMNVELGDRIDFITIGDELFIFKTIKGGYSLYSKMTLYSPKSVIKVRKLMPILVDNYGFNNPRSFEVKETKHEYKEAKLFKIILHGHQINHKIKKKLK